MKRDLLRLAPFLTCATGAVVAYAENLGWGMTGILLFLAAVTLP